MCDYSLEVYASRPAVAGEQVVLILFGSGSVGFADPGTLRTGPLTAVCCQPGTQVAFKNSDLNGLDRYAAHHYGRRLPPARDGVIKATMPHTSPGRLHRDALQFENGLILLLQEFIGSLRENGHQIPATIVVPDLDRKLGIDGELVGEEAAERITAAVRRLQTA